MDPEQSVNAAAQAIDGLQARVDQIRGEMDTWQQDQRYAPDYKKAKVAELREQLYGAIRDATSSVESRLADSGKAAEQILGGMRAPQDPAAANAMLLAAPRVQSALTKLSPAAAAEVFAEAGDIHALRALHAEIPVHVAATVQGKNTQRQGIIRELQDSVERRLEALADPAEGSAIRARRRTQEQRDRLQAVTDWALNPTAGNLMKLGIANGPAAKPQTKAPASSTLNRPGESGDSGC